MMMRERGATNAGGKMVGRNDPCWCGSGRKYKHCHMLGDHRGAQGTGGSGGALIKTAEQIEGMRRAGQANGELMDFVRPMVKAGTVTSAIDKAVHEFTLDRGFTPACLGYHGYPKSCCISINEVVCHGIPSDEQVIRDGDIVNVDLTTIVDGFYGDSSETFIIGEISPDARRLVDVTARAMCRGIGAVGPGHKLSEIAAAIEPFVREHGCSVVRQYTGHGIGREFHESFSVYHHVAGDNERITMQAGMTFTVEPMINLGDYKVVTDSDDGWTVRTRDGSLSAQFEHTVLVTPTGVEVLTLTPSQRAAGVLVTVAGLPGPYSLAGERA